MYGIEEATGLGGLAAQAPGGNVYLPGSLRIRSPGAMIAGDHTTDPTPSGLPFSIGNTPLGGRSQVSWGGTAVERPTSQQLGSWRQVLDFHNSPAPWILIGILLIYGWVHASYRSGRVRVGGGV